MPNFVVRKKEPFNLEVRVPHIVVLAILEVLTFLLKMLMLSNDTICYNRIQKGAYQAVPFICGYVIKYLHYDVTDTKVMKNVFCFGVFLSPKDMAGC